MAPATLSPGPASTQASSEVSFQRLSVALPPCASYPQSITHELHIRPHVPTGSTTTQTRSLFVANVPIDSTRSHFEHLFTKTLSSISRITSVQFSTSAAASRTSQKRAPISSNNKKRKRAAAPDDANNIALDMPPLWDRALHAAGSDAIVEFVDRPAMQAVWKALRHSVKTDKKLSWTTGMDAKSALATRDDSTLPVPSLGSRRYLTHFELLYCSPDTLQEQVDAYMTTFAAYEAAKERLNPKRSAPDEDGFVTVTKGSARGGGAVGEEEAKERLARMREKEAKERERLEGFYRFQGREKRKREARHLEEKLARDKARMDEMRRNRTALVPE